MTRQPTGPRRALLVALVLAVPACYSYVPVETSSVERGDDVRAEVRDARAGPGTASAGRRLEGLVVRRSPDTLTLSVPLRGIRSNAAQSAVGRDTVALAFSDLGGIERSKLDAVKTGGLVLGVAGLVGGAALLVSNAEGSSAGDGGGGGGSRLGIQVPIP